MDERHRKEMRDHAIQLSEDCRLLACLLALQSDRVETIISVTRLGTGFLGVVSVVSAYVPSVQHVIGDTGSRLMSFVAALTIIGTTVIANVIDRYPYGRYKLFANYLKYYSGRLLKLLADECLPENDKYVHIAEVINLAERNISDVTTSWSWTEKALMQLRDPSSTIPAWMKHLRPNQTQPPRQ